MDKTNKSNSAHLRELRAKAALFDELVEQLADTEDALERVRGELRQTRRAAARDGIDPAWRDIANDLAGALRPYSLFREQRVEGGRIVVHTAVPGSTLRAAREALDALGRQVRVESCREHRIPVREDEQRVAADAAQARWSPGAGPAPAADGGTPWRACGGWGDGPAPRGTTNQEGWSQ